MSFSIRIASLPDFPVVFELWEGIMKYHESFHFLFELGEYYADDAKEILEERLGDPNVRIFLADAPDGKTVGMLIASTRMPPPVSDLKLQGYIAETFVREGYRSEGIGESLFHAAKDWFEGKGVDHMVMQASHYNPGAVKFWSKLGFIPSTQTMAMRLD